MRGEHLGSTNVVADANGVLVSRHTYYPFGGQRTAGGSPVPTDYTFTGQKLDRSKESFTMTCSHKTSNLLGGLCLLLLISGCMGSRYPYSRQLTTSSGDYSGPRWSPDGAQIAYDRSGVGISMIDAQGTPVPFGSDPTFSKRSADWSPDGKKLTFVGFRGDAGQVYVMDTNGANTRQITFGHLEPESPQWAPNGQEIAVILGEPADRPTYDLDAILKRLATFQLFILNSDGTNLHRVTHPPLLNVRQFEWSPDGGRLVLTAKRENTLDAEPPDELFVINADGTNLLQIDGGTDGWYSATWSPDGKQILFSHSGHKTSGFYLINPDGSNKRMVYAQPDCEDPHWSRVTNQLLFVCGRRRDHGQIYTLNMADLLR